MSVYLKGLLKVGTQVVVSGKFTRRNNEIQTADFEFEVLEAEDADLIHTGRIVPKYALTAKLTQRMLRQWTKTVLDNYAGDYPEIFATGHPAAKSVDRSVHGDPRNPLPFIRGV